MPSSSSSSLSSPPSSDEESLLDAPPAKGIAKFFLKTKAVPPAKPINSFPPPRKRPASPPHEYGLADNPDIAFIVMFRSRFHEVFPTSLCSFGPQDLERGAVEPVPGENIENLLCALLGLVLNRKKHVERSHFQRALEEAAHTHASQWPRAWEGKNIVRGKTFASMNPAERLSLLKTVILWALSSSEAVLAMIKESYKQVRHDDDLNQPLSVQPWGQDGDRRRYWLVEGRDDTEFRLYRESNPKIKNYDWRAVAGSIDELQSVSAWLKEDATQAAGRLSERILLAIPRFEATQQRRKQREYRLARKAQLMKPEPGFSLYEGRTRGKKMKYTFSSEEEDSDAKPTRRSNGQSRRSSPREGSVGPVFTASGRQVRARAGGVYGETRLSGKNTGSTTPAANGIEGPASATVQQELPSRPRRTGLRQPMANNHIPGYNLVDEMDDEEDAASSGADEYVGDEGDDNANEDTAAEDMTDDSLEADDLDAAPVRRRSGRLIVHLKYPKGQTPVVETPAAVPATITSSSAPDVVVDGQKSTTFAPKSFIGPPVDNQQGAPPERPATDGHLIGTSLSSTTS